MDRLPLTDHASLPRATLIPETPVNRKFLIKVCNPKPNSLPRQSAQATGSPGKPRVLRKQTELIGLSQLSEQNETASVTLEGVAKRRNSLWADMVTNIVRGDNFENAVNKKNVHGRKATVKYSPLSAMKVDESIFEKNFNPNPQE